MANEVRDKMKTISVKNISELPEAAKQILSFAKDKKIFLFYGELGVGKTTLIKELCKVLGVTNAASSPTFAIVNEYSQAPLLNPPQRGGLSRPAHLPLGGRKGGGGAIYHFDLYRLKNESEIYDIGYEDYLFSGNYCFIEWPEKIEHLLYSDFIKVSIKVEGTQRIISLSC